MLSASAVALSIYVGMVQIISLSLYIHWYRSKIPKTENSHKSYVVLNIEPPYYKLTVKASDHVLLGKVMTFEIFMFFCFFFACYSKLNLLLD